MQHFFFTSRFISIGFTDNEFTLMGSRNHASIGPRRLTFSAFDRAEPPSTCEKGTKKKNNNLMNFSRCSYKMGGLIVFVPYVCTIGNIKKRYKRRDEILQWREHQDDFNRITEPNEWID
jgi:hypothetical protein